VPLAFAQSSLVDDFIYIGTANGKILQYKVNSRQLPGGKVRAQPL
jgi:hypothetical protein